MNKSRIKIPLRSIATRDEAEAMVGEISLLTLNQIRTTAKMDQEVTAVRQKYEGNLTAIAAELQLKSDTLRVWAEAHPEEFPKGRKSLEFVQGILGFRTSTPKVALLSRAWTWKKVLAAIKQFGLGRHFIHTEETVAKDLILASNAGAKDQAIHADKVLKPIGVKIIRDESFFVEPNITEVELRQVTQIGKEAA